MNGQNLAKEFGDQDILDIWTKGLEKDAKDITGFSQYKLPSGVIRIVYSIAHRVDLGKTRHIHLSLVQFKQITSFVAEFVEDPHFIFVKTILGDTTRYNCKVLDLSSLPTAKPGSEVTVFVRYTHREIPLPQIDEWIGLYGNLITESR